MTSIFSRIKELQDEERRVHGGLVLHEGKGLHRVCELNLLAHVARDIRAQAYVELGAGVGHGIAAVRTACPDIAAIGYEHRVTPGSGHSIIEIDVFTDAFIAHVLPWTAIKPLFVYTDNGNKQEELRIMSQFIEEGDMLGTHDWPNEVLDDKFLRDMGFRLAEEYEEYINQHLSLQRFWRR